jgi:hypothetical protein
MIMMENLEVLVVHCVYLTTFQLQFKSLFAEWMCFVLQNTFSRFAKQVLFPFICILTC